MEPYKDKGWLYDQYVKKRRNLTDICEILKNSYNVEVTPQTVYNWCEKYDLLKYRGKGRNLKKHVPDSPQSRLVMERRRQAMQKRQAIRQKMKKGRK
jgi:hypothetical protein